MHWRVTAGTGFWFSGHTNRQCPPVLTTSGESLHIRQLFAIEDVTAAHDEDEDVNRLATECNILHSEDKSHSCHAIER